MIKIFKQLGFKKRSETDSEWIGLCLFCGRENHFYINKKSFAWNCKSCGKVGGIKSHPLLEVVHSFSQEFFEENALNLSKEKKLKVSTLRKHKIGYLPGIDSYIIPVYSMDGKSIINLRIYKNGILISLSGVPLTLYGWQEIDNKRGTVWLCEGHWDAIALSEIIESQHDLILAVPGADAFKSDWITLLQDRHINVLMDNDEAGIRGGIKIYNYLKTHTRSLNFIHWPLVCEDGYDVRDAVSNNENLSYLKGLLKDYPPSISEIDVDIKQKDFKEIFDGKGLPCETVYKIYREHFELDNNDVIDILFGTIISNRIENNSDPVWLLLVSPPGCIKSSLIQSLDNAPKIFKMSTLTSSTLISGFGGQGADPSYIPRFNKKVVTIKDFTVILNLNQTAREEIFSILRDAYDGKIAKPFGNNIYREYESIFGILGGVTPIIEQYTTLHTSLGERFLRYNIKLDNSILGSRKYMHKAINNVMHSEEIKQQLMETASETLNYDFKNVPVISKKLKEKIITCAQFISMIRGTVIRDKFSKEVSYKPFWELGTRLSKQITKLLLGIGMFKRLKKVTKEEFKLIRDVTHSTIPVSLNDIIRILFVNNNKATLTGELSKQINLPRITTGRLLENLTMLNVIKKESIGKLTGQIYWSLTDEMFNLIKEGEIYE